MVASKKVALVTGANKGIGFEIARQLGELGIIVLMGTRDKVRGEAAAAHLQGKGLEVYALPLDITDHVSIWTAGSMIDRQYKKLDILVNNAAISIPAGRVPPSKLDLEVFQATFQTNVFGTFAVTRTMLPFIQLSAAGRIVNMSSPLGSLQLSSHPDPNLFFSYTTMPLLAYSASKTTINAITIAFARELQDTPIKVNSADPGVCATDLNNHTGSRTPAQGAKIAVYLATLDNDGPTGGFFNDEGAVPW